MNSTSPSPERNAALSQVFRSSATQASFRFPNAMLLGSLLLAVAAQFALAQGYIWLSVVGYIGAVIATLAGVGLQASEGEQALEWPAAGQAVRWNPWLAMLGLTAGLVTFLASNDNLYRTENVVPWIISILLWLAACVEVRPALRAQTVRLTPITIWVALFVMVFLVIGALFRFLDLPNLPADMIMDHREKLLDIQNLLDGTTSIFFERNTGREPWQFYWTAGLIRMLSLPNNYATLKLGTAMIGWLMLPAVFLLAREIFNTRIALVALLFAAVTSWAVLGARYGLRYPLAPCAVAWTMYFLARGLRRDERNSMLAAGAWLGIGLQGYTAYRFMAPVFGLLVLIWLVWLVRQGQRQLARRAFANGVLAVVLALLVMMPLVRYGFDHPDRLFFRSASRLTSSERSINGSLPQIFLQNVGNVLLMFNVTSDRTWVANIPGKPAVDSILGGLVVVGAVAALVLGRKRRDIWPALLVLSGFLMLLPSALSLAFPRENPSLVRTGGSIPMVMSLCAIVPGLLLERIRRSSVALRSLVLLVVGMLGIGVTSLNYQRVFVEYRTSYCLQGPDTVAIANAVRPLIDGGIPIEQVWMIGYDNGIDYRAFGLELGNMFYINTKVGADSAAEIDLQGRPGVFVLDQKDTPSLQRLASRYPKNTVRVIPVEGCPSKHFVLMIVQ